MKRRRQIWYGMKKINKPSRFFPGFPSSFSQGDANEKRQTQKKRNETNKNRCGKAAKINGVRFLRRANKFREFSLKYYCNEKVHK